VQTLIENPQAHVVEGSNGLLLEIDGQIVPNYDATMQPFEEGEVVTGNVVRIDKDEVLVDIGYKSEGVIPANELSIRKSVDPREEVSLGEEVDAMVLTKEDQDGRLIMSKKRARFEKAWRRIEAAAESGEPVMGSVIEVVKGGLIIDLGVRGFLPASLVDIRRVPNLDEYLGTQIETKVIELNRSRNNVVLSRRAVLEEERKEVRQQILDRLQPGLVVEGQISNIVDFGAFVDLDGIDGLIHISELSWSHVNHPSEILGIGDTVQVKVLDIDRDRQRISLGLKQTQEDPWQRIMDTYNVGDELAGKVTKVVTFGAFVEVLDGVEGLVHISELAGHHVESPREIVHPGDDIRVKILEIDSERRRLSLSAKRVEDQILPLPRHDSADLGEQTAAEQAAPPEATTELTADVADQPVTDAAEVTEALEVTDAAEVTDTTEVAAEPADESAAADLLAPETEAPSAAEQPAVGIAAEPTVEQTATEQAASEPAAQGSPAEEPVAGKSPAGGSSAEGSPAEGSSAEGSPSADPAAQEQSAPAGEPAAEGSSEGLAAEQSGAEMEKTAGEHAGESADEPAQD
jgi:small subunit ribosomal protein S1